MKKILFITTTPTVDGNGDALIEMAMEEAKKLGTETRRIDIRNLQINTCRACYGCAFSGVCVQKDDFAPVLAAIHEADSIVAEAPVYYNCMAAQAILTVDRLCCTFAYKNYEIGPKKKVAVMLTCTGSDVEEMKHHVRNILTLPSISRAISEYKTEVFTNCISHSTCRGSEACQQYAQSIGEWAAQ